MRSEYVLCALCFVLCALCYVLCAMCYVLCALCFVLCALCFVLCAMCYVLCALCYLICALCFVVLCVSVFCAFCSNACCVFLSFCTLYVHFRSACLCVFVSDFSVRLCVMCSHRTPSFMASAESLAPRAGHFSTLSILVSRSKPRNIRLQSHCVALRKQCGARPSGTP